MKIEINIAKKHAYILGLLLISVLGIGIVIASTGQTSSVFHNELYVQKLIGHNQNDIEVRDALKGETGALQIEGDAEVSGQVTAASFVGDGSMLTGITGGTGGASVWTKNGAIAYYNLGNVGIGTASPTAKLEVAGDIKSSGTVTTSSVSFTGGGSISGAPKLECITASGRGGIGQPITYISNGFFTGPVEAVVESGTLASPPTSGRTEYLNCSEAEGWQMTSCNDIAEDGLPPSEGKCLKALGASHVIIGCCRLTTETQFLEGGTTVEIGLGGGALTVP